MIRVSLSASDSAFVKIRRRRWRVRGWSFRVGLCAPRASPVVGRRAVRVGWCAPGDPVACAGETPAFAHGALRNSALFLGSIRLQRMAAKRAQQLCQRVLFLLQERLHHFVDPLHVPRNDPVQKRFAARG